MAPARRKSGCSRETEQSIPPPGHGSPRRRGRASRLPLRRGSISLIGFPGAMGRRYRSPGPSTARQTVPRRTIEGTANLATR
jgi:hypothetical protein